MLIFVSILFCQPIYGQVSCDENVVGKDYPPGCFICPTVKGNNTGYSRDWNISYEFDCGDIDNSVWYSFYFQPTGWAQLNIPVSNCKKGKGIEVAVYDEDLNLVIGCETIENDSLLNLVINGFEVAPGAYNLLIDGINKDECEFEITIDYGTMNDHIEPFLRTRPDLQNYCIGSEVCIERKWTSDYVYLNGWAVPTEDSIISGGESKDEEVCIYFKTPGYKTISFLGMNYCGERRIFEKKFNVLKEETYAIDTVFVNKDPLCIDEFFECHFEWNNDEDVDFYWRTNEFIKEEGCRFRDTFCKGYFVRTTNAYINVTPVYGCGEEYEIEIEKIYNRVTDIKETICQNDCFEIGDTCIYGPGIFTLNLGKRKLIECDSLVELELETFDSYPSPNIQCDRRNGGIWVEWQKIPNADKYLVYSNRDSFTTTIDNSLFIEDVPLDSLIDLKIQPIGACTYLPGEVNCPNRVSTIDQIYINNEILVFPNPTNGNIELKTNLKVLEVEIFNSIGRLVRKENEASFELKKNGSGIYFLKIKTNRGIGLKKVLVY